MNSSLLPGKFKAVTPSDTVSLGRTIGLYIGGTGSLQVHGTDGVACTFAAVPGGTILPGCFTKVLAATTATSIVAMYEG